MRPPIAAAAVLAFTAAAAAQPQTGTLRFQVSFDGVNWGSQIGVDNGFEFKIRAIAEWTDGAVPSVGFAGTPLEQIDLIGSVMSDDTYEVSSAFRRMIIPDTWSIQAGTGPSAGWTKIDSINPPARLNLGQLPQILPGGSPNPAFDAANGLVLFQMDCRYGFSHGDNITITTTFGQSGTPPTPLYQMYTSPTGAMSKPAQEAVVIPALVRYVGPTPGTAGLFFFAATLTGRRRRGQN